MKTLTILGSELPIRISPTFLQNAACPLCLKHTYVDKIQDRYIRVNTVRGSAAHEAIAALTHLCVDNKMWPKDLPDEEVYKAVAAHTPHEVYSELGNIYDWVMKWRDKFFLSKHMAGFEEKFALNEEFNETKWETATYRGIVDHIEIDGRHGTITDYKSSPHVQGQGELDRHEQLTYYAWITKKFYDHIEDFTCKIWFLQYGFAKETSRTDADLALYERKLMLQIEKIMGINCWDPAPGDHCDFCDYIHLCPIAKDMAELPQFVVTQEQAQNLAGFVRVEEVKLKKAKELLRKYVKGNEAIRLGDRFCYGYRLKESVKYDTDAIEEAMYKADRRLSEVARIDSRSFAKFMRGLEDEDPILFERLKEASSGCTHSTRFEGYKVGADDDEDQEDPSSSAE
jgi:hypothetical protein